jgi:hypothetical protein
LVLAIMAAGNVAVCAGWENSAEARMACCENNESCPMHKGDTGNLVRSQSISQTEADRCCAGSERHEAATSPGAFVAIEALPIVADWFAVTVESFDFTRPAWDTPPPRGHTSRQVLLSVFLI